MAYVTFAPKDPSGVYLGHVVVSVLNTQGLAIVSDAYFGTQASNPSPLVFQVPAGTYRAWLRTPTFYFEFPYTFVVPEGEGLSPLEPLIFEPSAQGEVVELGGPQGVCCVFGFVAPDLPGTLGPRDAGRYGSVETKVTGLAGSYSKSVLFERLGSVYQGESPSLLSAQRSFVGVDEETGYFEAMLAPNTSYKVALPGVSGFRYFTSPANLTRENLEALVDASRSSTPYGDFII